MNGTVNKNKSTDLIDEDLLRYNRHILLDEIDISGQILLKQKHVMLVGLGGLGSPVAMYLASSGIGEISIIDDDVVELTNLQRQIMYTTDDINQHKVEIAAKRINDINPNIVVNKIFSRISDNSDLKLFKNVDLLIDATDNFKTRNLINKFSLIHEIPLVMGAAQKFQGQVSVFRNDRESQPCYNCLYNYIKEDTSCVESGVFSPLTGIIGSIQASEVIKVLLSIGTDLTSKLMNIDIKNNEFKIIAITKDKKCEACNGN